MVIQIILITSTGCYLASLWLILDVYRTRRNRKLWLPIIALLLFTTRSVLLLVALIAGILGHDPDLGAELLMLGASVFMLSGVAFIPPFIVDLRHSREALQTAYDALEERVRERTQALKTGTEQLRTVVENLPVMVNAQDEHGVFVMWNRKCERVTGYSAEDIIGNPRAFELLYPDADHRAAIKTLIEKMSGQYQNLEIDLVCKNGTRRTIAWSNVSRQHPIPGWSTWAMGVDVTQHKRAQHLLFQTQETLEQHVKERTAALQAANDRLQREIAERKTAEEAEREQRLLAEALRDTAHALNSTLDLDEIFKRLLTNIKPVLPHDAANIMLLENDVARVIHAEGYAERGISDQAVDAVAFRVTGTPHMKRVIETGQACAIPDTRADPDWQTLDVTTWIQAYAVAPLRIGETVIGFLNLDSATPGKFTPQDVEHLQAFADQAAVAARNAQLYQQARRDLVERERAEIALRQSEQQLRTTLDALSDAVFVVDSDLRVLLVNEAFTLMNLEFGMETNPIGRTPFELFPLLPDSTRDEFEQAFTTGSIVITQQIIQVGSMRRISETRKIPIVSNGKINRVVTIIHDITDQKLAENALRESEERYRLLFERSLAGVFRTTLDGRILNCNEAFARIFGYDSPDDVLKLHSIDLYTDGNDRHSLVASLKKHRTLPNLELHGRRKDGNSIWILGELSLIEETGEPPIVEGTIIDITGRREAEQALRSSEERYRIISDLISDYAYSFHIEPDGSGTLEWITGAFTRITGYTPDEMNALGWEHFRHPDDVPLAQHREATLASGNSTVTEFRLYHKNGEVHWVRDHALPIWDKDAGRVVRVIGATTDITDQKHAEKQVLQLALEKERSRVLTDFITDTSHEFANPISVIKNAIYLISQVDRPDQRSRHLKSISGQIYHVEKLIEGLTTMSRLDTGVTFSLHPVDVNRVLHTIHDSLNTQLIDKQHTITLNLDPDLPDVAGDRRYLHQALAKLVENAVLYTPHGGTITIRTCRVEESIMIEINDTGIGIAAEHLDPIFTRFYRVDRARAERGAGLGLPIAKKIIEQHRGRVTVESTPGVGSTFRVFLPIPTS